MRWPTKDEINAALRHVYTGVGIATTVLMAVGLSQGDATSLGQAVSDIGDGVAKITGGVGLIVSIVSALWASRSSTPTAQVAKVQSIAGLEVTPLTTEGARIIAAAEKK